MHVIVMCRSKTTSISAMPITDHRYGHMGMDAMWHAACGMPMPRHASPLMPMAALHLMAKPPNRHPPPTIPAAAAHLR